VIILVTDGQETTSTATLAQAIAAARKARAAIYAVAIPSGAFRPRPLIQLARQTGGRYYRAPSSAALRGIYRAIAAELERVWRLEYPTSARPGDELRLVARVGTATATATERVPGQPAPASSSGTPAVLVVLVPLLLGGIVLVIAGTVLVTKT
jgi:hypothetical protein